MQLDVFEAALFGSDDEFHDRALGWLRRDIAFDGLLWRAGTVPVVQQLRVHGRPADMARDYEKIAAADPVCGQALAAPEQPHALTAAAVCSPGSPALAFWHGYDARQLLIFAKPDSKATAFGWLSLLRADGTAFSSGERQAMRHTAQAILTAQQLRHAKAVRAQAALPTAPAAAVLTERELAVAHAYADGRSVKEVARLLGGSASTVQCHLARIYRKLDVHSKMALRKALPDRRLLPRLG